MTIERVSHDSFHPAYDKLWKIIKGCRFGMLTTNESDGTLRSRPMTTVQKEFNGTLWFFTPANSDAAHAVEANEQACVAYANADKADFVSISGAAAVVMDVAIKEKLWSPIVQAWFPQGSASSEVALIKIDASQAEYWDSKSNKLVQLYSMATAYLKRTTPENIGEHRTLKL